MLRALGVNVSAGGLMVVLVLGLLVEPLAAQGPPAGKIARIGYLGMTPSTPSLTESFRQGLRDLGWVEGRNFSMEFRNAGGKPERLAELAGELVALKVDVIVALGSQATAAAKQATSTIPIVMSSSGDAVGTGLVASLARPGGNVTGLTFISPESSGKRLELLKEAVPGATRVAILWTPADPPRRLEYKNTEVAAQRLGVELLSLELAGPEHLESRFAAMIRERAQALIVFTDPITSAERKRIADLATKRRLPTISGFGLYAEAGVLMSYGPNLGDLYRRAAMYVDKILNGAKAADLPVEQPTKFELVINLRTARALGLTIPRSLLARADQLIQ
jgi:putative ABC transport system substrate-binding protein